MSATEAVNSLWIGKRLGLVERACLRSFIANGHRFRLWCYDAPDGVPAGVELRDAATILPEDSIIRHKGGSVSLFSNRFRYELQRLGLGIWADCDLYLLRPLPELPNHLFAWAAPGHICTAMLRLPASSPLIEPLLDIFSETSVPPWLPLRSRIAARWRLARTGRSGLCEMPWGSAGPLALTYLARRFGLDRFALPVESFYPVHWDRAAWIRDPSLRLEDVVAAGTVAVHLWNELIKGFKDLPAPEGSFLARLHREGAAPD